MQVNGWGLYCTGVFNTILDDLIRDVIALREKDPDNYVYHEKSKQLKRVYRAISETVPQDPMDRDYSVGDYLGKQYRSWNRVHRGIGDRRRLFFRFSKKTQSVVYAWINNKKCLRKDGDKHDVYNVFRNMLRRGEIAKEYNVLKATAIELDPTEEQQSVL